MIIRDRYAAAVMAPTTPLFLLAFDHRQSLVRGLFDGDEGRAALHAPALKLLVLAGLRRAVADGLPDGVGPAQVGVLVDDRYGAEAAVAAREAGFAVAVAVERTGQREVVFEHGEDGFAAGLDALGPAYAKVLVRYNAGDPDAAMNARQRALLLALSDWCATHAPKLLLELLVPPTDAQLAACGGSAERYDAELRPELVVRAMAAMQADGIAPALWKIEGLEDTLAARAVAAQALAGPHPAPCLVLGRGADDAKVDHWLEQAAPVDGFVGFAIGRSIWWDPLKAYVDGKIERSAGARKIAENFLRFVKVYERAEGKAPVAS
jgi:myo-inositol catabolism protein IolC